nr:hypothetical protein [Glycomyces tenuis]
MVLAGVVFRDRAFDHAWRFSESAVGQRACQDLLPDHAFEIDLFVVDDAFGADELVAGGLQGDGETGLKLGDALAEHGIGYGDADDLVEDQERPDLLPVWSWCSS